MLVTINNYNIRQRSGYVNKLDVDAFWAHDIKTVTKYYIYRAFYITLPDITRQVKVRNDSCKLFHLSNLYTNSIVESLDCSHIKVTLEDLSTRRM